MCVCVCVSMKEFIPVVLDYWYFSFEKNSYIRKVKEEKQVV
jgi:hypothetical protein